MVDLVDEGRALLALAATAHDPTGVDRARVRAALAARLGAAAGLGTAVGLGASAIKAAVVAADAGSLVGASATTAGTVAVGSTLATKLVGAIIVAAAIGGGTAAVHHARRPSVAHETMARPASTTGRAAPGRRTAQLPSSVSLREELDETSPWAPEALTTSPPVRAPKPARTAVAMREPVAVVPARKAANAPEIPAAPSPVAAPASPAQNAEPGALAPVTQRSAPAVDEEARLVGDGVAALRAGEPARALALFDFHLRHYPRGVLAEERAVERALTLSALGRHDEARAAAAEFLRAHPTSPLATRLRRSIPGAR